MNFEQIRQLLIRLRDNHDSIIYAQFTDWIQALYEDAKERVLRAPMEEREQLVGSANAYRKMLEDLTKNLR